PLMTAVFTTIYAIGGAYLALQPATRIVRIGEYGLTALEVAGLAIFLSIAIPEVGAGRIPELAPMIIAMKPVILLTGDIHWYANQAKRKQLRVARHLSRMIWAFVVVLRAPLVEIAAAGVPIPTVVAVAGPIVLAVAMHWYFKRRYGGVPFGRTA
ncbi:MAG: hypothetical protein AAGE86_07885, partial [Pseudomonadota bacterium]